MQTSVMLRPHTEVEEPAADTHFVVRLLSKGERQIAEESAQRKRREAERAKSAAWEAERLYSRD